jgi:hypothetical protein
VSSVRSIIAVRKSAISSLPLKPESVFQKSVDSAKVRHLQSSSTKAFFSAIRLIASLPRGNRNGGLDGNYNR